MNLNEIKDDQFLKNMKDDELKLLASDIRHFLLENISITGGHLSSNLGDVELIIAIHQVFDLNNDQLLFDVGHQAYTHKILTGRAKLFPTLRQMDGLSGFLNSSESSYDVFESGHSSTSISTAMGMAIARDSNHQKYEIISLIGDASIANGVAFEALNNLAAQKNKVIIILNDNDMSITKSVGAIAKSLSRVRTSKLYGKIKRGFIRVFKFSPKFINFIQRLVHRFVLIFRSDNLFDNFNISYLGPVDGHNFKALRKALKKAKEYPDSILIHVKTKKGKGYKYSEKDRIGQYHGVAPFNLKNGERLHPLSENQTTFTNLVAKYVYQELKNEKETYLISSAMVYPTHLNECFLDFPANCIDVGIAEEHSIALANGLALKNKFPYVSLYSTFMQRGYDEIVHDVCRINSNITFLIDRAGIVGEDGKTHQGVFDVSFLYPLENSIISMPSEAKYLNPLLNCLKEIKAPKFIRYQKNVILNENEELKIEYGKFIQELYNEKNTVSLICVGQSCKVMKELIIKENLPINLINPIFLKPIDMDCLQKISNTKIYIYDNTSVFEGFCSAIMDFYNARNIKIEYDCVPHLFIKHGHYAEVLKYYKLDEASILEKLKELL